MTKMFDMADSSPLFRNASQLAADGWIRDGSDWVRDGGQPRQAAMTLAGGRDAHHLDLSSGSAASDR